MKAAAAVARQNERPRWTELPPGAAILTPGSALGYHTGTWRSARPVWDDARCVSCGVCALFCPEGCLRLSGEPALPRVDLQYCKGCGICAHECLTGCIRMIDEEE